MSNAPIIVGEGLIPEAQAFSKVREALAFEEPVFLAAMWAPLVGKAIPDKAVIYNMEPLHDECRAFSLGYLDTLKRSVVLDYSKKNVAYLKERHKINAFYMPYGYHAELQTFKQQEKQIDFLFVGSYNDRRMKIVSSLRTQGVDVVWVTGAYGKELDFLLSISRVVLNIHYAESHPLEVVRLNYLLANGCKVISERSDDPEVDAQYAGGLFFADITASTCKAVLNAQQKDALACIKKMPMDCKLANAWVLEQQ